MPRRSKQQSDIERRTMEVASLLGREFSLPLTQAAAGSSQGLDTLLEQGFFIHTKEPNKAKFAKAEDFRNSSQNIPWSRRRNHYIQLGQAAKSLRYPPDEIAPFFEMAQQPAGARGWWIKAAEKACQKGDYSRALAWMDRALTLWPWNESPEERVRALREMARCAVHAGELETAARVWDELADYAADASLRRLQVEALGQLAGLAADATRTGDYLKRAAEVAERYLTPAETARSLLSYVEHLAERALASVAGAPLQRAVKMAERSGDPALISETRGWQGLIDAMSGRHASANRRVEESLRIALELDLKEQASLAYRRRANIQDYKGQYADEKKLQIAAIDFCRKSKTGDQLACMGCLSYACFRTGDWREAVQSARIVQRNSRESPVLKAVGSCVLGLIHAFRGERRQAWNALRAARERFQAHGFVGMEFFALWGTAYLHYVAGQLDIACEVFDQVRTLWRESDDAHDVVPALVFAGGIYADAGRHEQLADCLDIMERVLGKNALGEAKAARSALKAELARLDGRESDFHSTMTNAARKFDSLGLPLERLWTECRRVQHRCPEDAGPLRDEAVAIAKRLGARPMLAALQLDRNSSSKVNDLTPRQNEVLRLLAQGLTSKEIADRLGLSARTVEMHVGRLLARLNCRTRPEAVLSAIDRGWLR